MATMLRNADLMLGILGMWTPYIY